MLPVFSRSHVLSLVWIIICQKDIEVIGICIEIWNGLQLIKFCHRPEVSVIFHENYEHVPLGIKMWRAILQLTLCLLSTCLVADYIFHIVWSHRVFCSWNIVMEQCWSIISLRYIALSFSSMKLWYRQSKQHTRRNFQRAWCHCQQAWWGCRRA